MNIKVNIKLSIFDGMTLFLQFLCSHLKLNVAGVFLFVCFAGFGCKLLLALHT